MSTGDHLALEGVVESVGRGICHVSVQAGPQRRNVLAKLSGRLQKHRKDLNDGFAAVVPGVAASSSAIDALLARAENMLIELGA